MTRPKSGDIIISIFKKTMSIQDPTIKDVMSVVTNLATAVEGLTVTVGEIKNDVDNLADAFNTYATHTDSQISRIDNTMTKMQSDMNEMKSDMVEMKTGMVTMKSDITTIKSTMVTKSYLDDKIADVKGELITTIRKEDTKVKTVVEKLVTKKIFSNQDKKDIEIMPPFAAITV